MAEEWEDGGGWAVDDLDDPTSRHELSADGALGEEYRAMKAAKAKARSPVRDPYHNAVEEPVASREPPKESFRLMVVGEAGLGKTTLLESFFKSFKDDEALFALFERKETQTVIETRRQLDDAAARRAVCEREMKVAAEKMEYAKAEAKKAEIARLDNESAQLATQLKRLESADERRRNELRLLRERARNVRMEMKRAADAQQYGAAAEKRLQAELLQEEVAALQAELKQMRRVEGEAYPVDEEHERSSAVLHSSTVRITPFDPFAITVGKHELQVQLLDTPGYGDSLHAEESFDVICEYVEGLYAKQEEMEGGRAARDPEKLRHEDGLVHCCLYFIAPHRLKAIDVEFLRRLSPLVNIVPIIAKSDTMTTKEKEEFKLQVRETLEHEGIQLYAFDTATLRKMEQQDRVEYKPPWAVIGSTDASLDAGHTVYLRAYPWGNALSSEPGHSDLPALRNLIMWSGQWQQLKGATRRKYEAWRAARTLAQRGTATLSTSGRALASTTRRVSGVAKASAAKACAKAGVRPRIALKTTLLSLIIAALALAVPAAQWYLKHNASAARRIEILHQQAEATAAEKGRVVAAYEAQRATLRADVADAVSAREAEEKAHAATKAEKAALATEKTKLANELREAQRLGRARLEALEAVKASAAKEGCTLKEGIKTEFEPVVRGVAGWARGASERAWETSEGLAKDAASWAKEATVGAKGRLEGATKEFAKLVKEAGKRADFSPPVG